MFPERGFGGVAALDRIADVHLPGCSGQPFGLHGGGRSENTLAAVPQLHPRSMAGHDPGDPFAIAHGPARNDSYSAGQFSHISSCTLGGRCGLTCPDKLS
jgi:hypothetical protein